METTSQVEARRNEQAPNRSQPPLNTVNDIFEHFTENDRTPKYTEEQLTNLLNSREFLKRVASSKLLAGSFMPLKDMYNPGSETYQELTATKLVATISGFVDDYFQRGNLKEGDESSNKLLLDLKYDKETLIANVVKQLEGQDFKPNFAGGQLGEPRINMVAKDIVTTLTNELAFEDLQVKASIYKRIDSFKQFPALFNHVTNDPSSTLDPQKKSVLKRFFKGDTFHNESFKSFLSESNLSDNDEAAIFECIEFMDYNRVACINMINGHEQRPGFKEELSEKIKKLTETLADAHNKTLTEGIL